MARKSVAEPSVSDGINAAPEPTESGTIQVQPVRRLWMATFSGRQLMIRFMSLAYVRPSSKVTGW